MTTLHLYDGRKVEGQIYTRPVEKLENLGLPSKRYLNLIINGAKEAGLDAEYVKKCRKLKFQYFPCIFLRNPL